ncbi:GMC family oxidoreductase [Salinisphaera sp. Q1T1-3]|uniref:GMC family oxidoreductase n=1 Tax=Salinisphaera sp. Q1T1-3 TaxID=2321229 RepID=UPI000E70B9B2|nr:GMC family oxidoreductase N-terminal domain-containing protein [Salinisphaera sp. Q1T1-3]RJS94381.1 GMC family oxidoreductase [Salinisphaera sp. Q1T1-3]
MDDKQASAYDYVIVGGGSAGCVLANRLSADADVSVLLLEAGPPDWSPLIHIPSGIIGLMWSRLANWYYWTAPQQHMHGRRLYWPRGKTLGGSSAINAQCYTRGAAADYDHWAALGNRGWGYAEMLAYFKRSERFEGGANDYHGAEGSYTVSRLRHVNPLNEKFVAAAEHCGYPRNDDFGGATDQGFGLYNVAQNNGRRCSNADAFLHPVRHRRNLTVLTRCQAERIVFDADRATDVVFRQGWLRRRRRVRARREILLCGGAINSPQLLMLSGIGPRDAITPHGIDMVSELNGVGRNLQDHLDISVIDIEKTRLSLRLSARFLLLQAPREIYRYFRHGRGQFTSNIAESGGFISSSDDPRQSDLQFHFIATIEQDHGNLINTMRHHGYTLRVCDLHPASRGRITLASANPRDYPVIDPNYLAEPRDVQQMVSAVKIARRIMRAPPLAAHFERPLEPLEDDMADDAAIADYVRRRAETIYHPVGTCRMGHDPDAVVDDRLRVRGIAGLRVVDASIMPTVVGGNTNAPTTAIAEKAADMIIEDNA